MRARNKKLTPFGKLVVKALADQDMTKQELAAQVGISPQYLSYILNGTRSGEKHFIAIVSALGITNEGEDAVSPPVLAAPARTRPHGGIGRRAT